MTEHERSVYAKLEAIKDIRWGQKHENAKENQKSINE